MKNSPTHHPLHHSCNEDNLNKNFGETFLICVKLFATFKETKTPLTFGITEKVDVGNFNDVVFHELKSLKKDYQHAPTLKEKLKVIFGKPGHQPPSSLPRI